MNERRQSKDGGGVIGFVFRAALCVAIIAMFFFFWQKFQPVEPSGGTIVSTAEVMTQP